MSTTKVVRYTTTSCLVHDLKKERMCFHMKSLKSNKGFTLIELVVVIAILGILAGIAIPRFMDATATARGAKIVADLRTIDSAIMMYNAKTGSFPTTADALKSDDNTKTPAYFKLLASWPVPPTGTAKITIQSGTDAGKQATIDAAKAAGYTLNTTAGDANQGRALYNAHTVDELLGGTGVTK